jgi:hypothetical protein
VRGDATVDIEEWEFRADEEQQIGHAGIPDPGHCAQGGVRR